MSNTDTTHLDRALAEEFAGQEAIIHKLKTSQPGFKALMEENHELWEQIQAIQNGVKPASDETLETLEKQRLAILDKIAAAVNAAG